MNPFHLKSGKEKLGQKRLVFFADPIKMPEQPEGLDDGKRKEEAGGIEKRITTEKKVEKIFDALKKIQDKIATLGKTIQEEFYKKLGELFKKDLPKEQAKVIEEVNNFIKEKLKTHDEASNTALRTLDDAIERVFSRIEVRQKVADALGKLGLAKEPLETIGVNFEKNLNRVDQGSPEEFPQNIKQIVDEVERYAKIINLSKSATLLNPRRTTGDEGGIAFPRRDGKGNDTGELSIFFHWSELENGVPVLYSISYPQMRIQQFNPLSTAGFGRETWVFDDEQVAPKFKDFNKKLEFNDLKLKLAREYEGIDEREKKKLLGNLALMLTHTKAEHRRFSSRHIIATSAADAYQERKNTLLKAHLEQYKKIPGYAPYQTHLNRLIFEDYEKGNMTKYLQSLDIPKKWEEKLSKEAKEKIKKPPEKKEAEKVRVEKKVLRIGRIDLPDNSAQRLFRIDNAKAGNNFFIDGEKVFSDGKKIWNIFNVDQILHPTLGSYSVWLDSMRSGATGGNLGRSAVLEQGKTYRIPVVEKDAVEEEVSRIIYEITIEKAEIRKEDIQVEESREVKKKGTQYQIRKGEISTATDLLTLKEIGPGVVGEITEVSMTGSLIGRLEKTDFDFSDGKTLKFTAPARPAPAAGVAAPPTPVLNIGNILTIKGNLKQGSVSTPFEFILQIDHLAEPGPEVFEMDDFKKEYRKGKLPSGTVLGKFKKHAAGPPAFLRIIDGYLEGDVTTPLPKDYVEIVGNELKVKAGKEIPEGKKLIIEMRAHHSLSPGNIFPPSKEKPHRLEVSVHSFVDKVEAQDYEPKDLKDKTLVLKKPLEVFAAPAAGGVAAGPQQLEVSSFELHDLRSGILKREVKEATFDGKKIDITIDPGNPTKLILKHNATVGWVNKIEPGKELKITFRIFNENPAPGIAPLESPPLTLNVIGEKPVDLGPSILFEDGKNTIEHHKGNFNIPSTVIGKLPDGNKFPGLQKREFSFVRGIIMDPGTSYLVKDDGTLELPAGKTINATSSGTEQTINVVSTDTTGKTYEQELTFNFFERPEAKPEHAFFADTKSNEIILSTGFITGGPVFLTDLVPKDENLEERKLKEAYLVTRNGKKLPLTSDEIKETNNRIEYLKVANAELNIDDRIVLVFKVTGKDIKEVRNIITIGDSSLAKGKPGETVPSGIAPEALEVKNEFNDLYKAVQEFNKLDAFKEAANAKRVSLVPTGIPGEFLVSNHDYGTLLRYRNNKWEIEGFSAPFEHPQFKAIVYYAALINYACAKENSFFEDGKRATNEWFYKSGETINAHDTTRAGDDSFINENRADKIAKEYVYSGSDQENIHNELVKILNERRLDVEKNHLRPSLNINAQVFPFTGKPIEVNLAEFRPEIKYCYSLDEGKTWITITAQNFTIATDKKTEREFKLYLAALDPSGEKIGNANIYPCKFGPESTINTIDVSNKQISVRSQRTNVDTTYTVSSAGTGISIEDKSGKPFVKIAKSSDLIEIFIDPKTNLPNVKEDELKKHSNLKFEVDSTSNTLRFTQN